MVPILLTLTSLNYLEWHKPDNYYQLCRANYGSIGAQLTLAGYPMSFLDIYEPHKRLRSLNPNCTVISNNGSNTIVVDNNDLFPVKPYYDELLVYYKNGIRYTATYTNRTGTLAHATLGESDTFSGVSGSAEFGPTLAHRVLSYISAKRMITETQVRFTRTLSRA